METLESKVHASKPAIIWAVDPFQPETRPSAANALELVRWAEASALDIRPVHVLSIPRSDIASTAVDSWVLRTIPAARRAVSIFLKELGVKRFQTPLIFPEHPSSAKSFVQKVLAAAEESSSPLIVVSSHGSSGFERMIFGSFAESLLLQARQPVLFLNPDSGSKLAPMRRALFPTDLTDYSHAAFKRFLPQARNLDCEVILFHAVTLPPFPISEYGLPGTPFAGFPQSYFTDQMKWAREEAGRWAMEAHVQGVAAQFIVEDEGLTSHIAPSILEAATKMSVGLIALASTSGPVSSFVLGSTAREVFRANRYPVWICGPSVVPEHIHGLTRGSTGDGPIKQEAPLF